MPTMAAAGPRKRMPHAERRASALEAARKVFMAQGFGGASMRAIAAEAGVNEAMLYRICPSKKRLFEESVAGPLEEAIEDTVQQSLTVSVASPSEPDMRDLTRRFLVNMLRAMRDIAPLLNAVLLTDQENGAEFYKTRLEPSLNELAGVVESNLDNWSHRDFDITFMARTVFGLCWYWVIDERFSGREVNLEYGAAQLTDLIFDGLMLPTE